MEPARSSTNSTPWGAQSPAAITALISIKTHKQSPLNQVPINFWVERLHLPVKRLVQGHSATPRQARPVLTTSRSKVTGRSHHVTTLWLYIAYMFRYRDSEGPWPLLGACHFMQWSFYVPPRASETASPYTWSCQPREIQCFHCWRARSYSPQTGPSRSRTPGRRFGRRTLCPVGYCAA